MVRLKKSQNLKILRDKGLIFFFAVIPLGEIHLVVNGLEKSQIFPSGS